MEAEDVVNLFPSGFVTEVIKGGSHAAGIDGLNGCFVLRISLSNESDVQSWMAQFSEITKTQWIVKYKRQYCKPDDKNRRFVFSRDFVCHHSSYGKRPGTKKGACACPASIFVKIRKNTKNVCKRDDYVQRGLFAELKINNIHNHLLVSAEALKWHGRTEETEAAFIEYFTSGKSPAEARKFHEDILMTDGAEMLNDRSVNPPVRWVYKLHDKWRKEKFGDLQGKVSFNEMAAEKRAALEGLGHLVLLQAEPFVMSVVSPLMMRAFTSNCGPKSFFIDTSAFFDKKTHIALTLVLTATKAGAVPVGVSLHHSQNESSYRAAFAQLQQLWYQLSPDYIIDNFLTDDNRAMKSALGQVWPNVRQLLCLFQVPHALWHWLCDSKNDVGKMKRKVYMTKFLMVMRASTYRDASIHMDALLASEAPNSRFSQYLLSLWERRREWCMADRKEAIVTIGHSTYNYAEATLRMVKDLILCRLKSYSSLALLDYITIVVENYYCRRILNAAFGPSSKPHLIYDKMRDRAAELLTAENISITEEDADIYSIKASSCPVYEVNAEIGSCSCYSGQQGAFCKHQAAICLQFNRVFANGPQLTADDKQLLYCMATGENTLPPDFFAPSGSGTSASAETTSSVQNRSGSSKETLNVENVAAASLDGSEPAATQPTCNPSSAEVDRFARALKKLTRIVDENQSDQQLMTAMQQFTARVEKVTTASQAYALLCSSKNLSCNRYRQVRVQSTSVVKRREGKAREIKRGKVGKPKSGAARASGRWIKRGKLASAAVGGNPANAPSHGEVFNATNNLDRGLGINTNKLDHGVVINSTNNLDHGLSIKATNNLDRGLGINATNNLDHGLGISATNNLDRGLVINAANTLDHGFISINAINSLDRALGANATYNVDPRYQ